MPSDCSAQAFRWRQDVWLRHAAHAAQGLIVQRHPVRPVPCQLILARGAARVPLGLVVPA
ncbi:MAG: hypothetical protein KatS3mg015_2396 [Fimbriimonadales bacterium]|nr:MAG: hypothetical protein KatS3mg015_2396 [Fimbriimonadales bacterium]